MTLLRLLPSRIPFSTKSTSKGAATENVSIPGSIFPIASLYALLSTVPLVAITPTLLFLVLQTAVLAPGSITPMMGMSYCFFISSRAAAVEVLQAITISLTSLL